MPCNSDGYGNDEALLKGVLCGILSTFDADQLETALTGVNWKEAGVTRAQFDAWWENHQVQDAQRRRWEQEEVRKKRLRASALKKLSRAEREAIGELE